MAAVLQTCTPLALPAGYAGPSMAAAALQEAIFAVVVQDASTISRCCNSSLHVRMAVHHS